jgi:hypothetical protein
MKNTATYLIWAWGSTFAFAAIIYWLATTPNITSANAGDEVIKTAFRMLLYAVLFLLLYRSIIATLRNTVSRLSAWRSKGEAAEDAEFVLIIETFVVIVTLLATVLFSIFEEYVQQFVPNRQAEPKDVLVSIMAVLLTALIVYTMPAVGELEVALKQKFGQEKAFVKSKLSKTKSK